MIGTTGQGATDGMRFVQFYFGLPIAMVILGVTLVPFLHGAKVFTAYEYLERRFDAQDPHPHGVPLPLLARHVVRRDHGRAGGDLLGRVRLEPPASVAIIGVPTVLYTMIGGVQAVTWADVKQMVLIVGALLAIVVVLLAKMPVSPAERSPHRRGDGADEGRSISRFNLNETYTFWSRHARRHLPDAVLLRDRPEPGAALPGRAP